jgi:hypothetical protein
MRKNIPLSAVCIKFLWKTAGSLRGWSEHKNRLGLCSFDTFLASSLQLFRCGVYLQFQRVLQNFHKCFGLKHYCDQKLTRAGVRLRLSALVYKFRFRFKRLVRTLHAVHGTFSCVTSVWIQSWTCTPLYRALKSPSDSCTSYVITALGTVPIGSSIS